MRLTGQLDRQHFGPDPVWVLECAEGNFELIGEVPEDLINRQVVVDGELAEAAFGFAMAGQRFTVKSITPA